MKVINEVREIEIVREREMEGELYK